MIIKMPLIFKALPPGDSSGDEDATYRKPPRGLTRLSWNTWWGLDDIFVFALDMFVFVIV